MCLQIQYIQDNIGWEEEVVESLWWALMSPVLFQYKKQQNIFS